MGTVTTPQGVLDAIEKFCDEHGTDFIMPGYEFAHIVLDDLNLQDADIRWCLDSRADRWEQSSIERLKHLYTADYEAVALASRIEDIKAYRKRATAFLEWLLTVPESVRIDAEWLEHIGEIPEGEKGLGTWEL